MTLILAVGLSSQVRAESMVIHEWGTFTALQDDKGQAICGINVDDEPVPAFVHDAIPGEIADLNDEPAVRDKGLPAGRSDVTMRLETPVLYVHPGTGGPVKIDVHVAFHGGWLTQFYPNAVSSIPEIKDAYGNIIHPPITTASIGSLQWTGISTAASATQIPNTSSTVWTAPRNVDSATLTVGTESEKFLFYRGVGHLDAPVRVVRAASGLLAIHPGIDAADIHGYWLVDIRDDRRLAYRRIDHASSRSVIALGPDAFPSADYAATNRGELKAELLKSLIMDGLYQDEAQAMLATWEASYFHGVGLRLLFLAPHAWTDRVRPLTVSAPALISRVMMGRIDLISPRQRAQLATIATATTSTKKWWGDFLEARVYDMSDKQHPTISPEGKRLLEQIEAAPGALARLGVAVPSDYAAFLALGRFREALVRHALADHPSPALKIFAHRYGM